MTEKKFYYKFICKTHKNSHAWSKETMPLLKCDECRSPMVFSGDKKEIVRKTHTEIIATAKANDFKRNHPPKWVFL